jgi:hypothetical protein
MHVHVYGESLHSGAEGDLPIFCQNIAFILICISVKMMAEMKLIG